MVRKLCFKQLVIVLIHCKLIEHVNQIGQNVGQVNFLFREMCSCSLKILSSNFLVKKIELWIQFVFHFCTGFGFWNEPLGTFEVSRNLLSFIVRKCKAKVLSNKVITSGTELIGRVMFSHRLLVTWMCKKWQHKLFGTLNI